MVADEHITPASILFLLVWLGLLGAGVGYLLWWLAQVMAASLWLHKRGALALLPVPASAYPSFTIVDDDDPAALLRSATTMWAGLLADGREMGKRQRIKVAATGDGLRVAKPAVFPMPDVDFDEVGLYDRPSEQGGQPMARLSRWLVADEEHDTVIVGRPDPF